MIKLWISPEDYEALKKGELVLEAKGEAPVLVTPVDSVWFAENVLGIKLLEYQKKTVRAMGKMKGKQILYGKNGKIHIVDTKKEKTDD